jgi:hypothetical protein
VNKRKPPLSSAEYNSQNYWDERFRSGDWRSKGGYEQTRVFAETQVPMLGLTNDFSGSLCDFGCGAGDGFPTYRSAFPQAKLIGVDFSGSAISLCRKRHGDIAEFIHGTTENVPDVDIILCSNVLEHMEDDLLTAKSLIPKCKKLFIVVPYNETPLSADHYRRYDLNYFDEYGPIQKTVFNSPGWTQYGIELMVEVYLKNLVRPFLRRSLRQRRQQILFEIPGTKSEAVS